jgi:serine protease Do
MAFRRLCLILLACFLIGSSDIESSFIGEARAQPGPLPGSFADLVEKLSPAVVNISTTQKVKGGGGVQFFGMPFEQMPDDPQFEPFRDFFERFGAPQGGKEAPEREVTSLGSGFIMDATGYIITNRHVIDDAEEITVTLHDNSKHKAAIVGRDKKTDLALLKIDAKKPLPFLQIGDSDGVRVGDWVLAIGNPYGLGGSVTQGIISARQRSINAGPFDDFLQTDASINRGNSGGPLFDVNGNVIGINSAIFSPSGGNIGIGFSIPVNIAKPVIQQLKEFGRTHRAWLGVKIQEVSDEVAESVGLAKAMGALVVEVNKDSPAEKAGAQVGDVITHFDGKEISEMRFLPRMVAETKIGKTVDLTVWRKNKSVTFKATLTEMDEAESEETPSKDGAKPKPGAAGETVLSMELAPMSKELKSRYALDEKATGIVILSVKTGSEAEKRGLSEGAVLVEAGGEALKTVADFKAAVEATKKAGRKFVLLKVMHEKDVAFITLPVEEKK